MAGDVIGCTIDLDEGTIAYTRSVITTKTAVVPIFSLEFFKPRLFRDVFIAVRRTQEEK